MRIKVLENPDGFVAATEEDGKLVAVADGSAAPVLGRRPLANVPAGTVLDGDGFEVALPVDPGKIVAIGLNYQDHVDESGATPPAEPLVFTKFPGTLLPDGGEIRFDPELATRVDWEVELAVVIGRRARRVPVERALDHVFGYTVANDVSARDIQFADGQWVRGKSLDTFCPVGPVVVTADEITDPQDLPLSTTVDGEVMQNSNTSLMIFSAAEIISFCSFSFTLEPGDLILTGTPWGCGEFMDPVRSLQDGQLVETAIDGIGKLSNRVRTESGVPA